MYSESSSGNILIIGGGACGAFHGHLLVQAGLNVSMVCRSNFESVKEHGFDIATGPGENSVKFYPPTMFSNTAEAASSGLLFEHILVFTKATPSSDAVGLVAPVLATSFANNTTSVKSISLWQNGIGVEDSLAVFLASNKSLHSIALVSCVVYAGISRREGTLIRTAGTQKTVAGLVDYLSPASSHKQQHATQLQHLEALVAPSFSLSVIANIQPARWQKSLWSASIGLVSLVGRCVDVHTVVRTQEPLIREVMKEIVHAAGQVLGSPLLEDEEATFEDLLTIPLDESFKPDIVLDWESGRELDHQVQYGNLIRAAKAAGADVPRLEALYSVLQLMVFQRQLSNAPYLDQ
ncbi:ketopantoate reductase PanE/ApbA-domain-containing protein [Chytriomyces cf. hyalinus JEL632]|nr:ketopantoate reductase PanE/ApbA-domain-containing protein [Chytriomyces cf. hyalinus JEL632]